MNINPQTWKKVTPSGTAKSLWNFKNLNVLSRFGFYSQPWSGRKLRLHWTGAYTELGVGKNVNTSWRVGQLQQKVFKTQLGTKFFVLFCFVMFICPPLLIRTWWTNLQQLWIELSVYWGDPQTAVWLWEVLNGKILKSQWTLATPRSTPAFFPPISLKHVNFDKESDSFLATAHCTAHLSSLSYLQQESDHLQKQFSNLKGAHTVHWSVFLGYRLQWQHGLTAWSFN
jgi:hypothetical protein